MKRIMTVLICLFAAHLTFAQQEAEALQGDYQLNERYLILKSKSQTYKDYRVVNERVLDGFWKIVRDTLAAKDVVLLAKNKNIQELNNALAETQGALKQKEDSMSDVVFDSQHIKVLGINLSKGVFLTTVAIIVGIASLVVAFMSMRAKMLSQSMKQREDIFNILSGEFEEYKRKAMEKQTRLSRELQTERNRLSEMRGA